MTTQTQTPTLVVIRNAEFAQGYRLGRLWYFHGEWIGPIDDAYILTNIETFSKDGHSLP